MSGQEKLTGGTNSQAAPSTWLFVAAGGTLGHVLAVRASSELTQGGLGG